MGLVVQHNLPALNAQNQLRVNLSNNQKATEKLSSG
ncbi:MAG: flagellin, partial [Clostridiales bacterium]|nr:flagellin [Clostridiales bacterium]